MAAARVQTLLAMLLLAAVAQCQEQAVAADNVPQDDVVEK
jgi:hypothetical protein